MWLSSRALPALLAFLVALPALPALAAEPAIPAPLAPWVPWVLYQEDAKRCPHVGGTGAQCAWPTSLSLAFDEKGGTFTASWHLYAGTEVGVPGDGQRFPQDVSMDAKPVPVRLSGSQPVVDLPAGTHTLTGRFLWDSLPESIRIPEATGLLSLKVRGEAVRQPHLEDRSTLYLEQTRADSPLEQDTLSIRVHRMIVDEVPLRVETTVRLEVSGKGREVLLGRALLEGGVPMSVSGSVPARIEPDGRLRVQVRAGSWTVELSERHAQPVEALKRPAPDGPWTHEPEVWVWSAMPSLRVATVEGVPTIDPAQTLLPQSLRHLPTFVVDEGATFALRTERRGDDPPAPDRVSLHRDLWLDFDGKALTASDRLRGTLSRSWRLQARPEVELGRVAINGKPQFITRLGQDAPGVEVREGSVDLTADSRVPIVGGKISATGWQHDLQSLNATLHLPAGFSLLHARGVDTVKTWVSSWTLLDVFLLVVIAFATGRLFGWKWGFIALLAVGLNYHEPDSPRLVWLMLLAAEALLRVLPKNAVARGIGIARWVVVASFLLMALDYAIVQVRQGIYVVLNEPQVDSGVTSYAPPPSPGSASPQLAEAAMDSELREGEEEYDRERPISKGMSGEVLGGVVGGKLGGSVASSAPSAKRRYVAELMELQRSERSKETQAYFNDTVMQTGPGLPTWRHSSIPLGFSGPVQQGQEISLWLVPPWANQVLAFVRVLLLALLGFLLIGVGRASFPRLLKPRVAAGAAGVWLALATLTAAPAARAAEAMPSPELLEDLRRRLTEQPSCLPDCAEITRMSLEASPQSLRARLRVSAFAPSGVLLPGARDAWEPTRILINGAPATALSRTQSGHLAVVVPRGVHDLVLDGPLPDRPTVGIALPLRPRYVDASVSGWTIEGVFADGRISGDLQLTRAARAADPSGGDKLEATELPPYLEVERSLSLGLDWIVETTVRRRTPAGRAVVASIPLLPGEAVTTADVRVEGGRVQLNLAANANEVRWSSRLSQVETLKLAAPTDVPWSEVWRIETGPVWHMQASGLAPIHTSGTEPVRVPEFRPWQGETLELSLSRPKGVGGQTVTIDTSELKVTPGERWSSSTLTATFRASRGGPHAIMLPEGATLERMSKDGVELPLRQEGRKVVVPLTPGVQRVQLIWNQPQGVGFLFHTPLVDLGLPSVNAVVQLQVPEDRWVLFARGPRMGPAVLFWGVFLVLLVVAAGLTRVPFAPLRGWEWLLLCVGLSQVPLAAAALVPAWLLALGWRKSTPELSRGFFNLRQLGLVALTFIALAVLAGAITSGLLSTPEMEVVGNGSWASSLNWYEDRVPGALPVGTLVSAPLLAFRLVMLAWALWIAASLLGWLNFGWSAFSQGGLWQPAPPPTKVIRPSVIAAQPLSGAPPDVGTPPASPPPPEE